MLQMACSLNERETVYASVESKGHYSWWPVGVLEGASEVLIAGTSSNLWTRERVVRPPLHSRTKVRNPQS